MTGQTMQVQVKVLPWFSEIIVPGQRTQVEVETELPPGSVLRSLLAGLAARYARFDQAIYEPQSDALRETVIVTHNERLVSPAAALDLELKNGDTVALLPAYSGG